ncbi:MAG: glycosyltransferase [Nitrososphaerota archaeon]|nr:glycosyltransferase [Nitrososphaerota archaeon]
MKVLLIPPSDLLRHYIPNRLYHIARRLIEKHELILLSYPKHPLANGQLRNLLANEISYNALSAKDPGTYYVVNTPSIYAALKKIIELVDIVIHANILPSLIATRLAKKHRKPTIYDYVDHFPESAAYYYQGMKREIVKRCVTNLVISALKGSDIIVTPSYGLAFSIRHYSTNPIFVVPNGVDSTFFRPMDMERARRELGIDYEGPIALLQGSLDAWIEIAPILKALSKLRKQHGIMLLIVGFSHGKYFYNILESHLKVMGLHKHTLMYSAQPYEKMPLFIASSNFVIAPFKREIKNLATPLKIIEALACSRPVLTTELPEFKIWFKKGLFFYSSTKIEQIVAMVKYIVENSDSIINSLLLYSSKIRKYFDWARIAEEYNKIIETELLKN